MTRPDEPPDVPGAGEEALNWLFGLQRIGWTLGLERVRALLERQGDPHTAFSSILVGGTNGKGSTAAALAACLQAGGRRTGLFISPHLSRLGERFRVDGREARRDEVAAVVARVRPAAQEVSASFFEVLTAAACLYFAEAGVEVAVMEVGMGGRFDATNALSPELSVITGISLDHTAFLGSTEAEIAGEKAGIMRPDALTITGAQGEAHAVIEGRAAQLGAQLWTLGTDILVSGEELGWAGVRLDVDCPAGRVSAESPLVGGHQLRNLALAASAALRFGVAPAEAAAGLRRARWPGRLERLFHLGRTVILDGAHNPESAVALAHALDRLGVEEYVLLLGLTGERDPHEVTGPLLGKASAVVVSQAQLSPRAWSSDELAALLRPRVPVEVRAEPSPAAALAVAAGAAGERGTVLVAGSLYLVGEIRPSITGEELERDERWQ